MTKYQYKTINASEYNGISRKNNLNYLEDFLNYMNKDNWELVNYTDSNFFIFKQEIPEIKFNGANPSKLP